MCGNTMNRIVAFLALLSSTVELQSKLSYALSRECLQQLCWSVIIDAEHSVIQAIIVIVQIQTVNLAVIAWVSFCLEVLLPRHT